MVLNRGNGLRKRERSAILQYMANLYAVGVSSVFPFIVRTLLIRFIGIEYVGVSSLFGSVLQVLSVADFGLTTALAWFLYKPAELDDHEAINSRMIYFRKLFHKVGTVVLLAGLMVVPFLPMMVKGKEYPAGLNIYVVYLCYLLQTSLYYLLNSHLQTVFSAYLKGYIIYLISGTSVLFMYILQILSIVIWKNYYLYTALLLAATLIQCVLYAILTKKIFPWINLSGVEDANVKKDLKDKLAALFLSKIRNVSRNSFDSLIISMFFGLKILAEYQNYYQVMIVPLMFTTIVRTAIQPSLGNGIAVESVESNYGILKQYLFINHFIETICASCLISLLQPFMKLWVGEKLLLSNDVVISLTIYYYALCLAEGSVMLRETTGIWREGRWVAVVEAISNLILNIILARFLGLFGIVLATIVTVVLVNIPLESYYVFRGYFKGYYRDYLMRLVSYSGISLWIVAISYYLCLKIVIVDATTALVRVLASAAIPTILLSITHMKKEEMKTMMGTVNRIREKLP